MKRVMIIGCCGAGKSTLARKLQPVLNIPLFHLDQLHFNPGWEEMETELWKIKVAEIAQKDTWIIDGNYGGTMDIRLEKADTIIFLDYSRRVCMYRVIKRILMYHGQQRPDATEGCKERFDLPFLWYVFRFSVVKRPAILKRLEGLKAHQKVWVFKNDEEIKSFLNQLKNNVHTKKSSV